MKMRFIKLMQLVTGCVLAAAVLFAGNSGMVLCIGDDGHLAVESEHHSHCGQNGEASGHAHDAREILAAGVVACDAGGCIDVPLRGDEMSHAGNSLKNRFPVKISVVKDLSSTRKALVEPCFIEALLSPSRTKLLFNQSLIEKGTIVLRV